MLWQYRDNELDKHYQHIIVIVAIELRDVDIIIVTHIKARESVGYDVVFTFDIFKLWVKLFEVLRAKALRVLYFKNYKLGFNDQYRPLSGVLI